MPRPPAGLFALALLFALATAAFGQVRAPEPLIDADLLLQGGTLYLGDGQPGVAGDLAVQGNRIVAVGRFKTGEVGRVIDCRGLAVAPGFIDLHNHSDFPILKQATRPAVNYLTQGCTTIVTGNCGGGQVDVAAFLAKLDDGGVGTNVVHLVPHGAVRAKVMGRGKRPANDRELAEMRKLVDEGMTAGAWGMSTGLIYVPGTYADTDELVGLAEVVASHGGIYASHIRNESATLLDAVEEALQIGRRAQLPVHVSHFKSIGRPYWGTVRLAARRIEQARQQGQRVTADQYPYIASSTSLQAMLLPGWAREGGKEAVVKRMNDAEQLPKLRKEIAEALEERDQIQLASYEPKPEWAGKRLREIATETQRDVVDVAVEILAAGGGGAVNFGMSEDDVRWVMQLPWVATASDGGVKVAGNTKPHPRSFGTFTRKLGHYAVAEQVISLEHAVRAGSGLPADILGMTDRGYLRRGYAADVVVFDPQTVRDRATFTEPFHHSQGVRWVLVNGQLAIEDGVPTKIQAGRALRHGNGGKTIVVAAAPDAASTSDEKIKVLFVGKKPDHPFGTHMYMHTGHMLAKCLARAGGVETVVSEGWPQDEKTLEGVDTVVMYTTPAAEFLLDAPHRDQVAALMKRGVGLVTLHWASSIRKNNLERLGPTWLGYLGGTWVSNVGLHTGESPLVQLQPDHPICRGWKGYDLHDEYYLNPTIGEGATPLLQVTAKDKAVVVGWAFERPGGGRSYGTTLGHYYRNFQREPFRRMVVNAILWTAGVEVPEGGADVALSEEDLALPPKPE